MTPRRLFAFVSSIALLSALALPVVAQDADNRRPVTHQSGAHAKTAVKPAAKPHAAEPDDDDDVAQTYP
ncbi:MAG: hypothetical protein ACXWKW_11985, partial [Asticcacaulis sp.]